MLIANKKQVFNDEWKKRLNVLITATGNTIVAGILLMPPTRQFMLHLNDCCKWKEHIRNKKKLFCGLSARGIKWRKINNQRRV